MDVQSSTQQQRARGATQPSRASAIYPNEVGVGFGGTSKARPNGEHVKDAAICCLWCFNALWYFSSPALQVGKGTGHWGGYRESATLLLRNRCPDSPLQSYSVDQYLLKADNLTAHGMSLDY